MHKADFEDWLQNPVTRELQELFRLEILEQGKQWSRGAFMNQKSEELGVLGRIAGYYALIEISWQDVEDMLKEQKEPSNGT